MQFYLVRSGDVLTISDYVLHSPTVHALRNLLLAHCPRALSLNRIMHHIVCSKYYFSSFSHSFARRAPLKWRKCLNAKQRTSLHTCERVMARYTAQDVANLVHDSDFDAESDSDVGEDPDFPLPTVDSDDEIATQLQPTSTSPSTPTIISREGNHDNIIEKYILL